MLLTLDILYILNVILRSPRLPPDEHEIVLKNDGTWEPLPAKIELLSPVTEVKNDVDTLSVEDEDCDPSQENIITLDSDEEDDQEDDNEDDSEEVSLPPKKRAKLSDSPPSSPEIICLDDGD